MWFTLKTSVQDYGITKLFITGFSIGLGYAIGKVICKRYLKVYYQDDALPLKIAN